MHHGPREALFRSQRGFEQAGTVSGYVPISALYMGTIMERDPTPIPVINLPPKIELWPADTDVAWTTTPTMKMATLIRMAYFLDKISARNPE